MTSIPGQGRHDDSKPARLQALLRADAAAVIDDDLDDPVDEPVFSAVGDTPASAPQTSRQPSQVYSIRVPVEKLEQLRRLAKGRGMAPSAMLREWVLTQLDAEIEASASVASAVSPKPQRVQVDAAERHRDPVNNAMEIAAAALVDVTTQLTGALNVLTEVITTWRGANGPSPAGIQMLTPHPSLLAASSLMQACLSPGMQERHWQGAMGSWPKAAAVNFRLAASYQQVSKGVAELRSTVENASHWPGFDGVDLGALYMAADEELSNP